MSEMPIKQFCVRLSAILSDDRAPARHEDETTFC